MRIVFTGGGTGGHFYPIIAVVEEIETLQKEKNIGSIKLYFFSNTPTDKNLLAKHNIQFKKIPAGKVRTYFSLLNIVDFFVTLWGIFIALIKLLVVYPDVVFGKGGYASFPTLFAARILAIPVIIHDSDTIPGRVNKWAGGFAQNIALTWEEAAKFFPQEKVAITGQPIRKALQKPIQGGSLSHFGFKPGLPVITILGGSQGAQRINDFVLDILPQLVEKYQIIHQTGEKNFKDVEARSSIIFQKAQGQDRYKPVPILDEEGMKRMAGITTLIVSRSGSGILEFTFWQLPSILIPIPENISRDQRSNAYAFARRDAGVVIEEKNLTGAVFLAELERILANQDEYTTMKTALMDMARPDAAHIIAEELLRITLSHS